MDVPVRLGTDLANTTGRSRLVITLAEGATMADLLAHLRTQHPALTPRLESAVPIVSGRHASLNDRLVAGQEVALLLPVAGGSN